MKTDKTKGPWQCRADESVVHRCYPEATLWRMRPEHKLCGHKVMTEGLDRAEVHARLAQALEDFGLLCLEDSIRWYPEIHSRSDDRVLNHVAMGIGGEAGEVVDVFKKVDVCGHFGATCDHHKDGKHSMGALGGEVTDLLVYLSEAIVLTGLDTAAAIDTKVVELYVRNEPAEQRWCRTCQRWRTNWEQCISCNHFVNEAGVEPA